MKDQLKKRSFKSLIRMKCALIFFVVALGFGLECLNEKIDENREEAYLIGKTLRALLTLELFDDLVKVKPSDDKASKNSDLEASLSQSTHLHNVTIDDIQIKADDTNQCTRYYTVNCHAALDGDIHSFVHHVTHKRRGSVGIKSYDVVKSEGQALGRITFSSYEQR